MISGSIKMARSRTQLTTAQEVCRANVSMHMVRSDSKLSQLADGLAPHAKISRNRKATVQRVTNVMRIQLETSNAVLSDRPVEATGVSKMLIYTAMVVSPADYV